MKTQEFVEALDDKAIAQAIGQAEKRTSGEIRVFVSETLVDDPVKEAEKQFVALGMTKTAQRNGVLIYFAPKSQKYAVIGDSGVHGRCGQNFWQHITEEMTPRLKAGKFTDAIVLAVREIGEVLAREFPWESGDKNELPNQIARENNKATGQVYWENLYQTGDTRWEKGEPSPGLVDFLAGRDAGELPKGTVLVPGCGFGHDVRAWARAGFAATGMDVAPSAIRGSRERTEAAGLKAEFREGNFLVDEPFERFDYLFEHTLFCAINPSERDRYVQAVKRWLKPDGTFVAVFYMIPDTEGPPFGATRDEVRARFEPHFVLKEDWVPRSYPNRTGLEWMTVWRPT